MPVRKPPARRGVTVDKPASKPKRAPASRTRPRVSGDEPKTRQIRESVIDKQHNSARATATIKIVDGEVVVSGQISETVPVAQYANVVVLSGLQWKLGGINMEDLVDVDWGELDDDDDSDSYGESTFDYDALTLPQRVAYDRVMGARRATMKVLEHGTAEDRETVERSVRLHNEREARETEAEEKAAKAAKQRRRAAS